MFTFGIFSTHLPYVAFLLFYGFFFLFSVEKASVGDAEEGQQINPKVISVSVDVFPDVDVNDSAYCDYSPDEKGFEQLLLYEKEKKLFHYSLCLLKSPGYRFSWFSRPPPVA